MRPEGPHDATISSAPDRTVAARRSAIQQPRPNDYRAGTVARISLDPGSYRFLNGTQIQASSSLVGDTLTGGPAGPREFHHTWLRRLSRGSLRRRRLSRRKRYHAVWRPRRRGQCHRATGVAARPSRSLGANTAAARACRHACGGRSVRCPETAGGDGIYGTRVVIRGGVFEGGAVSNIASPNTPIARRARDCVGGRMCLVDPTG